MQEITEIHFIYTDYIEMQHILGKHEGERISGVYIIRSSKNEVLYVGYSANVCYRLEQHAFGKDGEFIAISNKIVRERIKYLSNNMRGCKITVIKNLPAKYEGMLIYRMTPKYNIMFGAHYNANDMLRDFTLWVCCDGNPLYPKYMGIVRYVSS